MGRSERRAHGNVHHVTALLGKHRAGQYRIRRVSRDCDPRGFYHDASLTLSMVGSVLLELTKQK